MLTSVSNSIGTSATATRRAWWVGRGRAHEPKRRLPVSAVKQGGRNTLLVFTVLDDLERSSVFLHLGSRGLLFLSNSNIRGFMAMWRCRWSEKLNLLPSRWVILKGLPEHIGQFWICLLQSVSWRMKSRHVTSPSLPSVMKSRHVRNQLLATSRLFATIWKTTDNWLSQVSRAKPASSDES